MTTRPQRSLEASGVVCVHLNDDFSGSGKVFANAIAVLKTAGIPVEVIVGSGNGSGFIRLAHGAKVVPYRFVTRRVEALGRFLWAQVKIFLLVSQTCRYSGKKVVYANTVLAPGAVLAGWMFRKSVVVHLHEVGLGSGSLFRALMWVTRMCATRYICVSRFVADQLALRGDTVKVIHNVLPDAEWHRARELASGSRDLHSSRFGVLMVCSLKWYKGLDSFLLLARKFESGANQDPSVHFRLVLNADESEWQEFSAARNLPSNLSVVCRPPDLYANYVSASLVLNLSHAEGWLETFGMTLLEAMACGIPVISPLRGGCTELFEEGVGGWRRDSRDIEGIAALIGRLRSDPERWRASSRDALAAASRFKQSEFAREIEAVFH